MQKKDIKFEIINFFFLVIVNLNLIYSFIFHKKDIFFLLLSIIIFGVLLFKTYKFIYHYTKNNIFFFLLIGFNFFLALILFYRPSIISFSNERIILWFIYTYSPFLIYFLIFLLIFKRLFMNK